MEISGFWAGVYFYPGQASGVKFDAEIKQNGMDFSGLVTEPNTFDTQAGVILSSVIAGWTEGHAVFFKKTYSGEGEANHTVYYEGQLSDQETIISGHWTVDSWSGKFQMVRDRTSHKDHEKLTARAIEGDKT